MCMDVIFFEQSSGSSPITKFIDAQAVRDQAAIVAVLTSIEEDGFGAKGALFKQLNGKLWEIKIKAPSGGYRFLYVTIDRKTLFILHAFKKKTQKTPLKEMKLARKRLKEIM